MNYLRQYIKLMRKAQTRTLSPDSYYEKHHVFPKSIFGENRYLVKLTFKEHVIAHHLLYLIYKKRNGDKNYKAIKMAHALKSFVAATKRESITDRELIRLVSRVQTKVKFYHTEETKKKLSESAKGKNNPNYGRCGSLHPLYGTKDSIETRKKKQKSHLERRVTGPDHHLYGSVPWNKGISNDKLKEASIKGRPKAVQTIKEKRSQQKEGRHTYQNMNTGEIEQRIFLSDMCRKHGLSPGNLSQVTTGKRAHTKGWIVVVDSPETMHEILHTSAEQEKSSLDDIVRT